MAKINIPARYVTPIVWTLYMSLCVALFASGSPQGGTVEKLRFSFGLMYGGAGILYALVRVNKRYGIIGIAY